MSHLPSAVYLEFCIAVSLLHVSLLFVISPCFINSLLMERQQQIHDDYTYNVLVV